MSYMSGDPFHGIQMPTRTFVNTTKLTLALSVIYDFRRQTGALLFNDTRNCFIRRVL